MLNFPNVSLLSVHDRDMYSQKKKKKKIKKKKKKKKYMTLTKIAIISRNKVDIENHYFCFFNVAIVFFLYLFNGLV